jgi:hypothetical protein
MDTYHIFTVAKEIESWTSARTAHRSSWYNTRNEQNTKRKHGTESQNNKFTPDHRESRLGKGVTSGRGGTQISDAERRSFDWRSGCSCRKRAQQNSKREQTRIPQETGIGIHRRTRYGRSPEVQPLPLRALYATWHCGIAILGFRQDTTAAGAGIWNIWTYAQ